ncbi:unnamed protein product, partial [Amoebophrya sp. A25]|eukprot:GSA25T00017245001.1
MTKMTKKSQAAAGLGNDEMALQSTFMVGAKSGRGGVNDIGEELVEKDGEGAVEDAVENVSSAEEENMAAKFQLKSGIKKKKKEEPRTSGLDNQAMALQSTFMVGGVTGAKSGRGGVGDIGEEVLSDGQAAVQPESDVEEEFDDFLAEQGLDVDDNLVSGVFRQVADRKGKGSITAEERAEQEQFARMMEQQGVDNSMGSDTLVSGFVRAMDKGKQPELSESDHDRSSGNSSDGLRLPSE